MGGGDICCDPLGVAVDVAGPGVGSSNGLNPGRAFEGERSEG